MSDETADEHSGAGGGIQVATLGRCQQRSQLAFNVTHELASLFVGLGEVVHPHSMHGSRWSRQA
jgi:hypothetical protein